MAWFQNACKRTLIFVLLTWGTIFFVPVSALANGVITVTTPLNGATVTVPFDVHFTYSGTDTYTKLWIDGVAIISDHNGSVFDYTVTSLAAGQHTLSLQAHDASSNTTVTLHETITVSTTPPTTVSVTPSPQTVLEGNQYTFNSNVNATWQVSGDGTIPSCTSAATSCTFVAGTTTGTATLTATATDGSGATGTASITISSLVLSPTSTTVVAGETQPYSSSPSSVPVSYSATVGLGSFIGNIFTAANTTGSGTVTATATDGSGASGTAKISVTPFAISPNSPSVAEGQTLTLNANAPANWSATGDGSVPNTCTNTTSCVFTANTTGTQAMVTATEVNNTSVSTGATVTIGPLTITPGEPPASPATTVENQTQTFTANAPIPSGNWSASCGTITPSTTDPTSATFTAPSSIPTTNPCTITASDSGGATIQAFDTVTAPPPPTGLNYTTWKNSNEHTGQQTQETTLTPANVNSTTFGLKFSNPVDGQVYAQPLYLSGITIKGSTHNVVFVATENDSVYAFDADAAGSPLWQTSFLSSGVTTASPSSVHSTIGTQIGITGTPVIDLNGSPNPVLYLVAETNEGGSYIHRLHALDVTTGKDITTPVKITGLSGFSSKEELQRPALILANGNVYVSFGSEGDTTPWHGWIFGFDTSNLTKAPLVWNSTPSGNAGGIWGGGGGLSADSDGNIYASTGNGNFNGSTEYSMSWVKLSPTLTVLDYWAPYNESSLSSGDGDFGSGAPVLVSNSVRHRPPERVDWLR